MSNKVICRHGKPHILLFEKNLIQIKLCNKVCVPNKTEDLNLSMVNIIAGINKSKILTKHISFKCKCKFDGRKCN